MRKNSGQIVLVVLLVMVVLLTVGLAVVSRSVTDIRISKEVEEASRAFAAAEAGIEDVLKRETITAGSETIPIGDLETEVTVTTTNSFGAKIERNETASVALDGFTGTGLDVNWSNSGLELTLFYDFGGYKIARWALDDGSGCGNNFTPVSSMPHPINFGAPIANPKILRIRPICAGTTVTVTGIGSDLPDQSYTIRSSATIPESGQTRVVEVIRSLSVLSPIFDYVLFSQGELSR